MSHPIERRAVNETPSREDVAGRRAQLASIPRITVLAATWLWLVVLFLGGACQRPATTTPSLGQPADTKRTEIERGPVRVTVEVAPHPVRLSDEPILTLTLDYESGVQIVKPPFGEAVGDFEIRDFRESLPETKADRVIVRQSYTLEPKRTGQLQIDSITVTFTDNRPRGDGKQHTLETEPLTIEVSSLVDKEAPSLNDLQGPTGPLELAQPARAGWWWLLGTGLLVLAVATGLWRFWRRRRPEPEPPLSPQELAYLELQRLVDEDLSQRDVKLFYVELTGVVRRYIERTTGIHAPEQTTQEFLREIGSGTAFSTAERGRLASFLESADMVKFAAHLPTAQDIEDAFHRAKLFLGLAAQEAAA